MPALASLVESLCTGRSREGGAADVLDTMPRGVNARITFPYTPARGAYRLESIVAKRASLPGPVLALFHTLQRPAWRWTFLFTHDCKHGCHDPQHHRLGTNRRATKVRNVASSLRLRRMIPEVLHHEQFLLCCSRLVGLIGKGTPRDRT
jgi:hypothetical protein